MSAPPAPARVPPLPKQLFSEWLQCGHCHTLLALCVIIDGQRVITLGAHHVELAVIRCGYCGAKYKFRNKPKTEKSKAVDRLP